MRIKFNRDISIQCEAGQTVDLPEGLAGWMIANGYAEATNGAYLDLSKGVMTPEMYLATPLEIRDIVDAPTMAVII